MATNKKNEAKPSAPSAIFDPAKVYTVWVYLHNKTTLGARAIQFVNQRSETLDLWTREIYVKGLRHVDRQSGIVDIIAPFNINHVSIVPQADEKTPAPSPLNLSGNDD